ncbi:NADPH-dependent FMN reductase [Rhizobium hidalgonense]|uniref:NADPH-dependent FMN reductase n=1 Tax=Rhizobium hidalgonense TaxID=1538159 RepID=A0AAJ2GXL0_9HYPH|nr:NADPH-dependent FMN reductase [Rhizobium hidalgonense]MDR9774923.1 NADPH-dependent FMN reductase [Rhizobium hidalgonense]
MKIVAITGNVSRPSKTRALGEYALSSVSPGHGRYLFDLVDVLPVLGTTLWRSEAPAGLANVLDAIQSSDVLVVGTPVFKSSMTGLLKHLFDLFEMTALQGRPVLIFATGKAEAHGEHVEAHLRSLMGFFKAEVAVTSSMRWTATSRIRHHLRNFGSGSTANSHALWAMVSSRRRT